MRFPVRVCVKRTVFSPAKVPMAAPITTSLAQCLSSYMRESPASVAPPYNSGPMIHRDLGHHSAISLVIAAATANDVVV